MSAAEDTSALREEVLSGEKPELSKLAAQGLLPLPAAELISVQVALARSDSEELAGMAQEALALLDPKIAADALTEAGDPEVLDYITRVHTHPVVLEAVLRSRDTPGSLLARLAPELDEDLQEILLLRQDVIVEDPAVLEALATNPRLTAYSRRRIREYRQHLVRSLEEEAPAGPASELDLDSITEEEVEAALAAAMDTPAEGEVEQVTGLTESQLKTLPVPIRLKLARGATRALRNILVRDTNTQVATSILKYNPIADSEVEQIAASRTVCDDVLELIARERKWVRKYPIVNTLVRNPKTPAGVAIRLIPRLAIRDLLTLSRERNVSEAVRSRAAKLYKIKRG